MSRRSSVRRVAARRSTRDRSRKSTSFAGRSLYHRQLRLEPLEDRRMLSASPILVTTVADTVDFNDGLTSLREAIFAANTVPGADTIEFASALTAGGPAKILLTGGELKITDALTINGPGADLLTIDASGNDTTPGVADGKGSRIFNIDNKEPTLKDITLAGLILTGGDSVQGGAIRSRENLTLANCTITGNASEVGAGGIDSSDGNLTITSCTFDSNSGSIAAVSKSSGSLLISDSIFTNNVTSNGSIVSSFNATLNHVTMSNNSCSANFSGGNNFALKLRGSNVSIVDCNVSSNQNLGGIVAGGSLPVNPPMTISVQNSTISGNGGIGMRALGYTANFTVDIEHCTVSDNIDAGVLAFDTEGGAVTVADCTISGNVPGQLNGPDGGGIRVRLGAGSVRISDCVVTGNSGTGGGRTDGGGLSAAGGITIVGSATATISGCTVFGNKTIQPYSGDPGGSAGGIAFLASGSITNCQVTGNSASSGGGIYVSGAAVTISGCSITDNQATADGGGVATPSSDSPSFSPTVSVLNSTIIHNIAARGGGIYGGTVNIQGCTISYDFTSFSTIRNGNGGGIYAKTLSATDCTISGNSAFGNGGGIFAKSAATLQSTTVTQNGAQVGGGAFIATGTLSATNTLLAANYNSLAPDVGGYLGAKIALRYTLVGNAKGSGLAEAPVGSPDANGNLIGGPVHGVIAPLLGPLDENGGFTLPDGSHILTMTLLPGSPAIDAGDPSAVAGANGVPQFDERGDPFTRVFGGRIDMGAIEVKPNPLAGDYNSDGAVDAADYTVWRDTLGAQVLRGTGADGSGNGYVDQVDYEIWRATFGNSLASSATNSLSVAAAMALDSSNPQSAIRNPQSTFPAPLSMSDSPTSPIVVTTLADSVDFNDGVTSLREAVFAANTVPGADTITFAAGLTAAGPAKILLTQGELKITDSLTITGPGADLLTIDASGNDTTPGVADGMGSRIFNIDDGNNTSILSTQISGLTLTGGDASSIAGAVLSRENLTLADCMITGNTSRSGAGGVYSKFGDLTVTGCTFTGNSGQYAALSESGAHLLVADSTFASNTTSYGTIVAGSNVTMNHVTVSNNFGHQRINIRYAVTISDSSAIADCQINANQNLGGILAQGSFLFSTQPSATISIQYSTITGNGGTAISYRGNASKPILDIEQCTLSDNLVAGIYIVSGSAATIAGCTVSNNRGTGVFVFGTAAATIANCQILGNTVASLTPSGDPGGGIRIRSSATILITDCLVSGNSGFTGVYSGGGNGAAGILISGVAKSATITGCTISGNKTAVRPGNDRGGPGGGILVRSGIGPTSITNCQIVGNTAGSGGGIYISGAGVTISDCSITGNHAAANGGGIAAISSPYLPLTSTTTIRNCTITGNSAVRGGGIYALAQNLSAANCTISGNSASANGGGAFIAAGTLSATNTLLAANNASALGPDIGGYLGTMIDLHYSLLGDSRGSGLVEAPLGSPDANGNLVGGPLHGVIDPMLGPLADNGGPTFLDGSKLLTYVPLPLSLPTFTELTH